MLAVAPAVIDSESAVAVGATFGTRAKWKFVGNKEVERKYEFIWNEGIFIDNVRLSKDGKKLEGKSKKGERVWAERVPAS